MLNSIDCCIAPLVCLNAQLLQVSFGPIGPVLGPIRYRVDKTRVSIWVHAFSFGASHQYHIATALFEMCRMHCVCMLVEEFSLRVQFIHLGSCKSDFHRFQARSVAASQCHQTRSRDRSSHRRDSQQLRGATRVTRREKGNIYIDMFIIFGHVILCTAKPVVMTRAVL